MRKNKSIQSLLLSYSGKFSSMSYSGLSRVSMDPRNKSEDDCSEYMSEDDKRECVLEDDFTLKSSLRACFFIVITPSRFFFIAIAPSRQARSRNLRNNNEVQNNYPNFFT